MTGHPERHPQLLDRPAQAQLDKLWLPVLARACFDAPTAEPHGGQPDLGHVVALVGIVLGKLLGQALPIPGLPGRGSQPLLTAAAAALALLHAGLTALLLQETEVVRGAPVRWGQQV